MCQLPMGGSLLMLFVNHTKVKFSGHFRHDLMHTFLDVLRLSFAGAHHLGPSPCLHSCHQQESSFGSGCHQLQLMPLALPGLS